MSPRLQRLGARVLGRAPTLAPRVAARFEPTGNEPAESALTIESTTPPASSPPPAPPPDRPTTVRIEQEISPMAAPPRVIVPEQTSNREIMARTADTKSAATPPRAPANITDTKSHAHPDRLTPAPLSAPASAPPAIVEKQIPSDRAPPSREPADPSPETKSDTVSKRDLASEVRRLRDWMSDATPPATEPPAPPKPITPRLRAAPEPAPRRPTLPRPSRPEPVSAPPAPPAAVEINIGTIVVRATTPEGNAPRAAAPVNRAAGLAQFLARRSAGLP